MSRHCWCALSLEPVGLRVADCLDFIPNPVTQAAGSDTGIVLIHGYGGGTFSWRHIMGALARTCGCRVIAFDRPAFGAP